MDLATPYDRIRDFLDRIAAVGDVLDDLALRAAESGIAEDGVEYGKR